MDKVSLLVWTCARPRLLLALSVGLTLRASGDRGFRAAFASSRVSSRAHAEVVRRRRRCPGSPRPRFERREWIPLTAPSRSDVRRDRARRPEAMDAARPAPPGAGAPRPRGHAIHA